MREALARLARAVSDCAETSISTLPDDDLIASLGVVRELEQQLEAVKLRLVGGLVNATLRLPG